MSGARHRQPEDRGGPREGLGTPAPAQSGENPRALPQGVEEREEEGEAVSPRSSPRPSPHLAPLFFIAEVRGRGVGTSKLF